jgi:hypothetical protein
MEYTVEKFVTLTQLGKAAGAAAGMGDNAANAVVKNLDLTGAAKGLDDVPITKMKRATIVGGDVADEAGTAVKFGDDAAENVAREAAEKAARETVEKAAKEAGEKAANEVAEKVAKEAAEKAAKEATEKAANEAADKLNDTSKTNQKLSSKIAKLLKDNPGKTLGGVLLAGLGVAGLVLATESFNKSNNQPLTIIDSYATKGGDEGDVTIEYTADSGVTVVDGDSVIVNPPNDQDYLSSSGQVSDYFIPSAIYSQTIQVKTIISSSSIVINYPGLVGYTKKGILTLQTTMENRMLDQAEKGINVAKELTGTVLGPVLKMLGPYLIYAQGFCAFICCLILISIIYKVSKMAN